MIDNLRRTVTAPLALATLLLAWTVSSASAVWWSALVVASVLVPAAMPVVAGLIPHRKGISKRSHLRDVGGDLVVATAQVILEVTFLAHQALLMLDAVVRTLVRLFITRRHLLEWQTAAQVKAERDLDIRWLLPADVEQRGGGRRRGRPGGRRSNPTRRGSRRRS